jgi:hypothetical protein
MFTVFKQLVSGVRRARLIAARNGVVCLACIGDGGFASLLAVFGLRDGLRQVVHHLRLVARHFVIRGAQ